MSQSLFDVTGGGPLHWFEYRSSDHGKQYGLRAIGPASARPTASFDMTPGLTYAMRAGAYHAVWAHEDFTATIVVTGPAETDTTYVLTDSPVNTARESPPLSLDQLLDVRAGLGAKLAATPQRTGR